MADFDRFRHFRQRPVLMPPLAKVVVTCNPMRHFFVYFSVLRTAS